jgi:5,10-methylenetetrahydromethanopterin reductase
LSSSTRDAIPLHISAFGPRGRRVAAKLGAHWMTGMRNAQSANAALADMQMAWREAGRDPATLYATAFGGGCVLADGEPPDSPRAKAQAGPAAAIVFHNNAEEDELGSIGFPAPPQFKAKFEAYRQIYRSYEPADARYLSNHRGHLMFRGRRSRKISGDVIRASLTGARAELVDGLRAIKASFRQFGMQIRTGHEMSMLEDWASHLEGLTAPAVLHLLMHAGCLRSLHAGDRIGCAAGFAGDRADGAADHRGACSLGRVSCFRDAGRATLALCQIERCREATRGTARA